MCIFSQPKQQQTVTPVVASTENRAAVLEADLAELERRRRSGVAANILTTARGIAPRKHSAATTASHFGLLGPRNPSKAVTGAKTPSGLAPERTAQ